MVRGLLFGMVMLRLLGLGSIVIATACTSGADVSLAKGDAADPVVVSRACRGAPEDPLHLATIAVEGDRLRVTVSYGGGCAEHAFAACWDGIVQETAPPRTSLALHHDGNGDACDALISHDVLIDVSKLEFAIGLAGIADPAGTIELVGR